MVQLSREAVLTGRKIFSFLSFSALAMAALYLAGIFGAALFGGDLPSSGENPTGSAPCSASCVASATLTSSAPSSPSYTKADSSAVPTASPKNAKGKIITKTISPDGANLKYNKIFIKNTSSFKIDLRAELLQPPTLRLSDTTLPQVLIVHTHTTECYMSAERDYYTADDQTRTTDEAENIVAVGRVLAEGLIKRGIGVVHATEKHDYPEYSGSYSRAEKTIKKYLEKYPTIKVVIDLHRDSITDEKGNKTAPTVTVRGKRAAQLMLVSGCMEQTVTDFKSWRENFRLAIRLQQALEVTYPSLARPILLTPRRYNQHLTTGSLLIECGTEANTLAQAEYSAELLSGCLAYTLNTLKE